MPSSVTAASVVNAAIDSNPTGGNFKKLDFYLAKNEVALYPKWNVYDTLFGSIKWEPNMGNTLTGTTPTPSPILRTTFMPEVLTNYPKKDQFTVGERTEDASLGMHRFESNRFRFLNNFEAFWRDHLSYAQSDIVRQIQCANNTFIRTLMYYQAPDAYISSKGLSSQVAHTSGMNKKSLSQAQMRLIENGSDDITGTDITGTSVSISHGTGQNHRNDVTEGGGGAGAAGSRAGVLTLKDLFKAMLVFRKMFKLLRLTASTMHQKLLKWLRASTFLSVLQRLGLRCCGIPTYGLVLVLVQLPSLLRLT